LNLKDQQVIQSIKRLGL